MTKTDVPLLPDLIGMIQAALHVPASPLASLSMDAKPASAGGRPAAGRVFFGGLLEPLPTRNDTIH
ncbi:MAG: hypothetical protein GEU87_13655 [Alphaproteobacteria bacterium]|nr:hypothetical protein [Alphaproteobacteria bacterium]